jgi:cytochrome c-type biogenesis protein CcmE
MSAENAKLLKFGSIMVVILLAMSYLAYTGVQESKSYYVTIKELNGMGDSAYTKRLRVAGNVQTGSIKRTGLHLEFMLNEEGRMLPVVYSGTDAPPDTLKDDAQALAEGEMGRDGVFRAKHLQAKCASKYAPKQPGVGQPGAQPAAQPGSMTAVPTSSGSGM